MLSCRENIIKEHFFLTQLGRKCLYVYLILIQRWADHPSHWGYIWLTAPVSHAPCVQSRKTASSWKQNFKSLWKCEWSWGSPNTSDIFQSPLPLIVNKIHAVKSSADCTQENTPWRFMVLFSYRLHPDTGYENAFQNDLYINGEIQWILWKGYNFKFQTAIQFNNLYRAWSCQYMTRGYKWL